MPFVWGIQVSNGTEKQLHGKKGKQDLESTEEQNTRKYLGSVKHLKEIYRKWKKKRLRKLGKPNRMSWWLIVSAL